MKKITLFLTFALLTVFSSYAQFPSPYCGPVVFDYGVEPITSVNFTTINNIVSPDNEYDHLDFTDQMASVDAGNSYPITLKGFTDGPYDNFFSVFMDWNQDGDFLDEGESYQIGFITGSTGEDAIQLVGSIAVPSDALPGVTRIRIVKAYGDFSDSCVLTNSGFGQAHDYSVTVVIPQCLAPSNGVAAIATGTSANLSWTSTVTNSHVVVQAAGTGVPSSAAGTGVSVSGTTYLASNLAATTAYEFYVRNECSTGVFSSWAGPFAFNTTLLPGCASNPTPADNTINVTPGPITLSWSAPTTGDAPTSYDLFVGTTADDVNTFIENYTGTNTGTDLTVNAYNATIYWRIAPKNAAGDNMTCAVWTFTTAGSPGYCLVAANGQYPSSSAGYTPTECDGFTPNVATTAGYSSEYSLINVTSGQTYRFNSSVVTDFITIGDSDGTMSLAAGVGPLTWVSTVDGQIRFYTHVDDQCGEDSGIRARSVICGTPSSDQPDFANLQFPGTINIDQGDSETVYGQVYEAGLTDVAPNIAGQAPGINAWIGISPIGANTDPSTWNNWTPMSFNAEYVGNNDEYMGVIGATLAPGTYYYATRFRLNNGPFVYGGFENGFWNGTTNISGVLTISPPPAPDNDFCATATPIIVGEDFCDGTNTNGTTFGSTASGVTPPACFYQGANDVWFTFVVPAGVTTVNVSTDFNGGTLTDTQIALYSGVCGTLVEMACDQDSGTTILTNGSSYNSIISNAAVIENQTYYVRVSGYNTNVGSFCLQISSDQLAVNQFDANSISVYPNPVKSILTIQNSDTITSATIFNLLGQQVIAKNIGSNLGQLDMSALPRGTYIVKIVSNDQTKTLKVIKE